MAAVRNTSPQSLNATERWLTDRQHDLLAILIVKPFQGCIASSLSAFIFLQKATPRAELLLIEFPTYLGFPLQHRPALSLPSTFSDDHVN